MPPQLLTCLCRYSSHASSPVPVPDLQEGIHLTLAKYPETVQIDLGVAAMGVESPEGTFLRTGAQMHRLRSDTELSGMAQGASGAPGSCQLVHTQLLGMPTRRQHCSVPGSLPLLSPQYREPIALAQQVWIFWMHACC
jgi:hypothetical protein